MGQEGRQARVILWMLAGAMYWEVEVGLCHQGLCQYGALLYSRVVNHDWQTVTKRLKQSVILLHLGVCLSNVVEQFTFELVGYLLKINASL